MSTTTTTRVAYDGRARCYAEGCRRRATVALTLVSVLTNPAEVLERTDLLCLAGADYVEQIFDRERANPI
jgi:hypothetical protein